MFRPVPMPPFARKHLHALSTRVPRRSTRFVIAFILISITASAFVVGRSGAAGGRFSWPTTLSKIFGNRNAPAKSVAATSLSPAAPFAACTWNGTSDTDWATPGNWTGCTGGGVPQSGDTVSIGTATNQPTISSAVGNVGAITIGTGGTLTVTTGGSITSTASMSFSASGGALVISGGSMTVGTGSGTSIAVTNSGSVTVQGGTLNIAGRLTSTTGSVTVSSGALNLCTIGQSSATASFDMSGSTNLTISGGVVTLQKVNAGAGGDLLIASGSGTKSITGGTFQIGNTTTPASQTFKINSSIAIFNLTIDATTTTKTAQLITSALTAKGDISIQTGSTLDANSLAVSLAGNWTNSGNFINPGTVTFNGTLNQSISGSSSTAFTTLAISNTGGGGSNTVSLGQNVSDAALNITSGIFDQGGSFNVTSGAVNVSSGAAWNNIGTGDLILSGGVANAGTITFNGAGAGCPQTDDISITSSGGTQRAWSGLGTFSMTDVSVQDQGGTAIIGVRSGTSVSGNGLNWLFVSQCTAYVWTQAVNTDWTNAGNWAPTRTAAPSDILIFGSNTPTPTVTNVAGATGGTNETIAELHIQGSAPTFSTASGGNTLNIVAGAVNGFDVNSLNLSGANPLIIKLGTGTLGTVSGFVNLAGGAHQIVSNTTSAITFQNSSIFATQAAFTGNPFGDGSVGNGAAGSIIFATGSTYIHNAGSSPFGSAANASVVNFQPGSEADWLTNSGFQASGRTYANLVLGDASAAVNVSDTGAGSFQFDNLTVKNTGSADSSLSFTGSGSSAVNIKGNVTSTGVGTGAGGTLANLTLTAGSGGIQIDKAGTITFDNTGNSRSILFLSDATVTSGTTLALGRVVQMGLSANGVLTVNTGLTPNVGAAGYVVGNVLKTFAAAGSKTFEVGTPNGYSPVDVDATTGTFPANFTVKADQNQLSSIHGGGVNALQRNWTITGPAPGTVTANLTFHYLAGAPPTGDIVGTPASYVFFKRTAGVLSSLPPNGAPTSTTATINGISSFSDWTLAEPSAVTPGTLQFSASNYNDTELNSGTHPVTITVTRTGGTDGAASVHYATSNGSATTTADNDYDAASGDFTWADGDANSQTFTVTVHGDTNIEPNQTVNLTLSSATGATLGSPNPATLTIVTDDICSPPSTVYVDASWVGTTVGADPDGGGLATAFGCDSFATIQDGINGVATGGTVIVAAGTYVENPSVTRAMTIKGAQFGVDARTRAASESIVRTNGNQVAVFSVTAANVTIDGFTIDGDDPGLAGPALLKSGDDTNTQYGVRPTGAGGNLNVSNNIIKKTFIGVRGDVASQGNVVNQNSFDSIGNFDFGYCVSIRNNFYANVTNNKMTRAWTGIHINNHSGATGPASFNITGNEIHSYAGGILYWLQFNGATGATIGNNQMTAEAGAVANNFGVLIVSNQNAVSSTFTSNTISGHAYGVGLFNVPTTSTITLGATNSIAGSTLAGVFLTDHLDFNPVGTTDFLAAGDGAASTVNLNGMSITGNTGDGIKVQGQTNLQTVSATGDTVTGSGAGSKGLETIGGFSTANVTSSTITGFATGIALASSSAQTVTAHFNRIIAATTAIANPNNQAPNLENNWWGCNAGPGSTGCGAVTGTGADFDPWIVLGASATPPSISPFDTSTITADMTKNSAAATPSGTLPDMAVAWSATNGTMASPTGTVSNGTASTTFTSTSSSSGTGCATVDNQQTCANVTVVPPSFTIDDVSHLEGNGGAGTTAYTFTITKTGGGAASVKYETVNGTATAPSDFTAIAPTTVSFLSTDTTKQFTVLVNGDTTFEATEAFTAHLSNAVDATIADADGTGTITNDDTCGSFATVYVDASWAGTPIGEDPDGGGPATVFGCDSFATIQDGINGVTSGGTVIVRAGTYAEAILINKPVTLQGAQAGQNANTRFAAFVAGGPPNGPKANPSVESVITAAAVNPNDSANNPIHIMSSNVIIDGFVVDGNNPGLPSGGSVLIGGINTDARRGIQTDNAAGTVFFPANNVQLKNNVVQNFVSHGIQLINGPDSGSAPATSGSLIDGNVVRNFGGGNGSANTAGSGIVLRFNAYADITNNTVITNDYPTEAGIWIQDFLNTGTPHTTNINNNTVTVGQDNFGGIWVNLAYLANLNINNNTVNAATGVTSGSDYTYGIYLSSLRPGATASLSGNIVGSSGGQFDRGIALWNVGTSPTTTTVTGGTVGKAVRGVSLVDSDANFGLAGSNAAASLSGVSISGTGVANPIGISVDATGSTGDTVALEISGNTSVTNTATAISVIGANASANIHNNSSSIHDNTVGISVDGGAATITSNNLFANATSLQFLNGGTSTAHFNRIISTTTAIANPNNLTPNLQNNWWGCNAGPGNPGCGAVTGTGANFDPWIVLGATATPPSISPLGTSTITADMTKNSAAATPSGTLPDMAVAWSATNGTMASPTGTVSNGTASTTFTSTSSSSGTGCATVDNQQSCANVTVVPPSFTIDDVSHLEGNGGAGTTAYLFTITKTGGGAASVKYETVNGTATAPSDFTAIAPTTVSFLSTDTTKQFTVLVNGDTTFEATEAFTAHLSNAVDATIADADGTGTITNDDTCGSFATVYVDATWAGTAIGEDPDGGGPATVFGCDSFATIQGGIDGVSSGGTVIVHAGTYTQTGTINLNKSLTLQGPNSAISPNGGARVAEAIITGTASSILRISSPGSPVTIQGFKFENTGVVDAYDPALDITIRKNIFSNGASGGALYFLNAPVQLTIDDNYLTNAVTEDNDAIFVAGNWNGTTGTVATITNNVIQNTPTDSSSGMNLSNVSGTVTGNQFTKLRYYAILLANNSSSMTISGNTFDGMVNPDPTNVPTWGSGVRTYTPAFTGLVSITGNTFKNSYAGVGIRGVPNDPGADISGMNIHVNFNRFINNNFGVSDGAAGTLDAQNNWWGCNYGPGTGGAGCSSPPNGIKLDGTAAVDADPWIVLGTSASPNPTTPGGNSTVTADMTHNSDAATPAGGPVPLIPVAFSATNGTMAPPTGTITAGQAMSTFTSNSTSAGTGCATVDNQNVCTNITITLPEFSIDDVTQNEGNGPGTTSFVFTVTKTGASGFSSSVNFTTMNGTATQPSDYALNSGMLTFPASLTNDTQQITVLVNGDTTVENNEAFTVRLSGAVNATVSSFEGTGTGSIINDDTDVNVAVSPLTVPEDDTTNLVYTFTRNGVTSDALTVNFSVGGTAKFGNNPGDDYLQTGAATFGSLSGTVTIGAGNSSATVTIDPTVDATYEADETVVLTVTSGTGYNVGSPSAATGTINNDDNPPTILVVNSTLDTDDGFCLQAPDGNCTLREAINAANANPDANTIKFNIPVSDLGFNGSVFTIKPLNGEYALSSGLTTIDGASQTVFTTDTNPAGPEIVIDGSSNTCGSFTCSGFSISSPGNSLSGLVINNFTAHGISMFGAGTGNTIKGCYVGTDSTGTVAAGNAAFGITSNGGNTIGGLLAGEGNLISGNGFPAGFGGIGSGGASDIIQGNKIGTNVAGTAALANKGSGVVANGGGSNVIEGNLISGNTVFGIELSNGSTDSNTVKGNKIGTDAGGTTAVANGSHGIRICCGAGNNTIGGSNPGDGNVIAFNGGAGVVVQGLPSTATGAVGNHIFRNSIFANTGLGIDLANDGVTPNDPGDTDTDPDANNLQNFPVIRTVLVGGPGTIRGTLNSTPSQTYTIDLYSSPAGTGDPSGNGEGKTYLGSTTTTTGANGDGLWSLASGPVVAGEVITATATDASGNTSEFSVGFVATTFNPGTVGFAQANTDDNETNVTHTVPITVTRTGGSDGAVSVNYSVTAGSATIGEDYTVSPTSGTFTWANGNTANKTITITVNGDTKFETDEIVNLTLSNVTGGASLGTNPATLTIKNDDSRPTISINDIAQNEGDVGTSGHDFTVSLSNPSSETVTVDFATAVGITNPATVGTCGTPGVDYQSASGTVTFAPTVTSQPITIQFCGDNTHEQNEQFVVNLTNPMNATSISDNQGVGTITNDDPIPSISINNVSHSEGNTHGINDDPDLTNYDFTVSLTNPSDQTITVDYATANDTATAGSDYTAITTTTLTFNPGETSKPLTVVVNGDITYELNERFFVNLSNVNVNATILDGQGDGTITNDDPAPVLAINDRNNFEGTLPDPTPIPTPPLTTTMTFTVTKTGPTDVNATVHFATADGGTHPATGGASCTDPGVDYITQSGNLTFPASGAGATSQSITIVVCKDSEFEPNETFFVNLSAPTDATLGNTQGVGTIKNDDIPSNGLEVTSTNDVDDGVCSPAPGHCSLREAINAANNQLDPVAITFAIPANDPRHFYYADDGTGTPNGHVTSAMATPTTAASDGSISGIDPDWPHSWWSILPTSPLPDISQQVFIEGYTQSGATVNTTATGSNAVLRIELDGDSAGANVTGLVVNGLGSAVRGLVINRFKRDSGAGTPTGIGLDVRGSFSSVAGNFVGTDVSGTLDLGNGGSGIVCGSGGSQTIGGTTGGVATPEVANLISGNDGDGITVTSISNVIQGNWIGTSANGTSPLGNSGSGIGFSGAGFNTVGIDADPDTNSGEGNTIAFNTGDGVRIATSGVGNSIRGNSIFSNGSGANDLGIDLGTDGVTPNDLPANHDSDTGPNNLQNFPLITSALVTGSTRTITGTLNSTAGDTFTIDFYQSPSCDTSGNGEGKTYLGTITTAATDSNGDVSFTFHPALLTVGQVVTATATSTGATFSTSEFSACSAVTDGSPGAGDIQFTSASYSVGEGGGTASITVQRVGGTNGSITSTFSTSNGSAQAPGDYAAVTNFPITYVEGETGTKTVTVSIFEDTTFEGNETVSLSLSHPRVINAPQRDDLAPLADPYSAVLTITENDPAPTFTINDVTHNEGNSSTTAYTFTVTKTGSTALNASVDYATVNGTATGPSDFTAIGATTLTFLPADTTKQFTVLVNGDTTVEPDEAFSVHLSNPVNVTISDADGAAAITNDDTDVTVAVSPASVAEDGVANLVYTFTRSGVTSSALTANFSVGGTATFATDYTQSGAATFTATSGTVTFGAGLTTATVTVDPTPDTLFEPNETVILTVTSGANYNVASPSAATGTINNDDAGGGIIRFNSATYNTTESSGVTTITVERVGDTSAAATVDYTTPDDSNATSVTPCATISGAASPRCDFTTAIGTLRWAAGDGTPKTFNVLISQDNYVEGPETLTLTLSNLTGGAVFGAPSTATLTIADDATEPAANPIDDASNFVRQQYHDFLNREPDASGLAFWTNEITSCGSDQQCIDFKRVQVSAAFYISIEFQDTGYLVERLYKAAYGDANGISNFGPSHTLKVPIVRFSEFLPDTQEIGLGVVVGQGNWQQQLENNKQAFAAKFVQRARFTTAYPNTLTPAQFVDTLFGNAGVVPTAAERQAAIDEFGGAGTSADTAARGRALRRVAENATLTQQEFNRAFVLMQYFGYLRRNPNSAPDADHSGFDFWLTKLNQFNGNFQNADMVKSFLVSTEYRNRAGQ